jgi:hypothetical protein
VNVKIGIWLRKQAGKGISSINRDYFVFGFFLLLSFIFWYLNSLGKEIETEIRYPVRYINLPKERVLAEELPSRLNLYLKGPGYEILKLKLSGNRAPAILDISTLNYRRVPGSKDLNYYLKTSGIIPKLKNDLRSECQILYVKPDTLFFKFDRIIVKRVPVISSVEVITDRQYFIKGGISIEPDSIKISGPLRILDTVANVRTKYRKFTGVNETVRRNINLDLPDYFSASARKVSVTIPVEQFTEAELTVPVKIMNQPDSIDLKIFPDVVTVRGLVAVNDFKKLAEIPFEVIIDIGKVNLKSSERIPLEIRNVPPFLTSLRITPADVDFLIEKKTK